MNEEHPDFERLNRIRRGVIQRAGGEARLIVEFPQLVQEAIDFVLDPIRTARTRIVELDNVEKTFVGLKIEHYFRDFIDVPKGLRDLTIDDDDVDVKNTVSTTWMIPPETYGDGGPCLLIRVADSSRRCWLGLMLARLEYLNAPNRDGKRGVSAYGKRQIMWIVEGIQFPASYWAGIDMNRFRELRRIKGGAKRAALFFEEYLGRPIHRRIVQSLLFDQEDYMKRLRGNGGARDLLAPMGIRLLSGQYDSVTARELRIPPLSRKEFLAVRIASPPSVLLESP